jgi:hypothetical protein
VRYVNIAIRLFLAYFCDVTLQRPKLGVFKNRKSISFLDDDKDGVKASRSDEKPDDDGVDDVDKSNRRYSTSGINLTVDYGCNEQKFCITKLTF